MQSVVTVGLDIAKNVFQAHGVDAEGEVVFRKRITRAKVRDFFASLPKCLVGIEACASSHHWAREIGALGHTVKLMPPAYVKPYVKSQKNDSADAEAICEAVTRPNMRFAEVKSVEQQSVLAMHKLRATLIRHRTRVGNSRVRADRRRTRWPSPRASTSSAWAPVGGRNRPRLPKIRPCQSGPEGAILCG